MHRVVRVFRLRSDYTHYQTDLTKRFGSIRGSKLPERGYSVAASVVVKDTKAKRVGHVPKNERRAMVEDYVIKYKTINKGKFPTPSETKEQVGGGYYTIKNILQEIQHRSKLPPTNSKVENALRSEVTEINEVSTDGAAISVNHPETVDIDDIYSAYSDVKSVDAEGMPKKSPVLSTIFSDEVVKPITEVDVNDPCHPSLRAEKESKASAEEAVKPMTIVDGDNVDPDYSKFKGIVVEEEPKASTLLRETLAEEVVKPKTTVDTSSYIEKQKHELEVEPEKVVKHLHSGKGELNEEEILPPQSPHPQGLLHKASSETDKLAMVNFEKQTDNEELPKQSMWSNLKSFADGIMKTLRGM